MNNFIKRFNEIQDINKKLNSQIKGLPQIVVIGSQSSGKSSVLESIIGGDFLPKGRGMVTRCPLRIQLLNGSVSGSQFLATFRPSDKTFTSFLEISKEIKKETENKTKNEKIISEEEIVLEMIGLQFPNLTLVDLPGLIQNVDNDQPKNLENQIRELMLKYIKPSNTIILAISPANIDLATSEIVKYAKEVDPQGKKTIHVLTKLDIINEGETAADPLTSSILNPNLGVIGVINRNERDVQGSMSLEKQRTKENKFFAEKYPDLVNKHGTNFLVTRLENILIQAILESIPTLQETVKNNIEQYENELESLDSSRKNAVVSCSINKFCDTYKNILKGNLDSYDNGLEGGSLISECLYVTFISNMMEVKLSRTTDDEIYNIIKNTTGTRDVSFSFMKPFKLLIKREITKFDEPCKKCLEEVENKLNEFVDFALEKIKISVYPKVEDKFKEFALDIIDARSKRCHKMIKDYISSEIEDITFTNPYKDILKNIISNEGNVQTNDNEMKSDVENKNNIQNMEKTIIKNLMTPYFEMVQKNIKHYVPKTIQTFLINGISKEIHGKMQVDLLNENILESLIGRDSDRQTIAELRIEIEKSKAIRKSLKSLKY